MYEQTNRSWKIKMDKCHDETDLDFYVYKEIKKKKKKNEGTIF